MKKITKKQIISAISLLLVAILVLSLLPVMGFAATASELYEDFNKLRSAYEVKSGWKTFTLTTSSRFFIVTSGTAAFTDKTMIEEIKQVAQLASSQFAADGHPSSTPLPVVYGDASWVKDGDIVIGYYPDKYTNEDAYGLCVGLTGAYVTLQVVGARGALYGMNTLLKHLRLGNTNTLTGLYLRDVPDTVDRIVSLDCGRKYYTKEWICNFIREMSWMGYNTLQLHFSDDSGFRMDLWDPAYYTGDFQPENDFSWICGSNYTSWTGSAYQNDPDKGKYLSTAEVIEILNVAKQYHIDVIPSFDSPAHMDYLTWKFEQNYKSTPGYSFYSTTDKKTYKASDVNGIINYTNSSGWTTPLEWPYYAAVNINSAQAKAFVMELYIDIANFFKEYAGSTDFSIGADEVNLNTANLDIGYSFQWGYGDFVDYINDLNELLNDMGYTMRMYNDFIGTKKYSTTKTFDSKIEIQYWDSPFNPTYGTTDTAYTKTAAEHISEGRVIYNCINTYTYYALRITSGGSDARSIYNRQWTFYRATEENIYNEWYSNAIKERGDYTESVADVTVAGAYYLIWGDYACVSTEMEIWNGVYDKTSQNTGEFYSLRDRMWSNITKMWNKDVNNTVTYSEFAAVRDALGDFPGCTTTGYSTVKAASLPAAQEVTEAYLADHSALDAALATKISGDTYTAASYAAYETAYIAAQAVHDDHGATQTEVDAAVQSLADAQAQLVAKDICLEFAYKTTSGELIKSETYDIPAKTIYSIPIYTLDGYTLKSVTGASFTPNGSGSSAGTVTGVMGTTGTTVSLVYTNTPDISAVKNANASALTTNAKNCTSASWAVYTAAVTALNDFYTANASNPASTTTQADICAELTKLQNAYNKLVVESAETKLISHRLTTDRVSYGKQAVLLATTTPNIAELTISGVTLNRCYAQITTDDSGATVKVWYLAFTVTEDMSCTLQGDGATLATFTVNCG